MTSSLTKAMMYVHDVMVFEGALKAPQQTWDSWGSMQLGVWHGRRRERAHDCGGGAGNRTHKCALVCLTLRTVFRSSHTP